VPFTITEHLLQCGGSLAGAGGFFGPAHLEIADGAVYDWQGGMLSGAGQLTIDSGDSGGTMNMCDSSGLLVSEWNIVNNGTVNWTAGNFDGLGITFTNSGTMTASGSLTYSDSLSGALFSNGGTLNVLGTVEYQAPFRTTGSVNVSDILQLDAGGAIGGANDIGNGSQIILNDGLFQGLDGAQGNGDGAIVIGSDTGMPTLNVQGRMTEPRVNLQNGGTITGPGTLTISTRMNWSRGTMSGTGTTTIGPNAELIGGFMRQDERTLQNLGTITWQGSPSVWSLNTGATIINANNLRIVLDDRDAGLIFSTGGSGQFQNAGVVTQFGQRTGASTRITGVDFTNDGVVVVKAGTLQFGSVAGALTQSVNVRGGYFDTACGAEVDFVRTRVNISANPNLDGPTLRGAGWHVARTSVVTVPAGMVVADNFQLDGDADGAATLTGAGTFEAHNLLWTGGTMSGGGTTLVAYSDYMEINTGAATLSGRQLTVYGLVQWDPIAGALNLDDGSTLLINGGTLMTFVQAGVIRSNDTLQGSANPIVVKNDGVFQTNATEFPGGIMVQVPFWNGGSVRLYADTTFTAPFTNAGVFYAPTNDGFSGGFRQTGDASASYFGGGTYTFTSSSCSLGGLISLAGGTMLYFGISVAGTSQNTTFALSGIVGSGLRAYKCTLMLTGDLYMGNNLNLMASQIKLQGYALSVWGWMTCDNQCTIYLECGSITTNGSFDNEGAIYGPGVVNGEDY
jgi:hypothetical protein